MGQRHDVLILLYTLNNVFCVYIDPSKITGLIDNFMIFKGYMIPIKFPHSISTDQDNSIILLNLNRKDNQRIYLAIDQLNQLRLNNIGTPFIHRKNLNILTTLDFIFFGLVVIVVSSNE
jgi:hypothetical protein